MPKPSYIICSEFLSQDINTEKICAFNIYEKFRLNLTGESKSSDNDGGVKERSHNIDASVIAVWVRNESEHKDTLFEAEFVLYYPNNPEVPEIVIANFGPFRVEVVWRLKIEGLQLTHAPGSGLLRIESRIRKIGDNDWLASQSTYILLYLDEPDLSKYRELIESKRKLSQGDHVMS